VILVRVILADGLGGDQKGL